MGKFNKATKKKRTLNKAGGKAYNTSWEFKLVSILLTSFVRAQFYRSEEQTLDELKEIVRKVNPLFAAKAAIFARTKFGMRSITHVMAAMLSKGASGTIWGKNFYNHVIHRLDDMGEILSFYKDEGGKSIPGAMKKGFANAFDRFDGYQLAKYKGTNKGYSLVDIANLVHPVPTEKNKEALESLINGTLKNTQTWEAKLSSTGGDKDSKSKAWRELLAENKLGYFALLKNLSNIMDQAPDAVHLACKQLVNENRIKRSLVMPFRYLTAYREIEKKNDKNTGKVLAALSKAIDVSCNNVPVFDGRTLVVLDDSGSMGRKTNPKSPASIGSIFSAFLLKANSEADFIMFNSDARYVGVNTGDSALTIANNINFNRGGTNFPSIFRTANSRYDRIIILSDMQGWIGNNGFITSFNEYRCNFDCDPFLYSFDLKGYGTSMFPEDEVFLLAGFSDKIFDIMSMLESDKNALINEIMEISFE